MAQRQVTSKNEAIVQSW